MTTTATTHRGVKANDPVIELQDASVSFSMDRGEARVLDGVTLGVKRGEILGVVGESGSGKSMLASAMLDAVEDPGQLTGGVVYHPAGGESVDLLSVPESRRRELRWEEISMVFQGAMSSFNPTMRLDEHFRETLAAHNADVTQGMTRARELLGDLHLDPGRILDSYPHELSGGMSQRALIALSLVLDPEVLVMDEPTAALDLLMQRSILALLRNLQEKYDLTIVFITHDLPLVAGLADRLAVMYAFDLLEVGPADALQADPAHPYTRALLRAVPNLNAPLSKMRSIEGSAPDPVNVPSGCRYAPRCPLADEQCRIEDPPFYDVGKDHLSACHYAEQARSEVPLTMEESDE